MRAAYKDLREFLSVLEQEGQMLRIHDQVLPEPDIAAAACALTEIGENSPAIHFDNIAGFTDARVAMNVHGSWCNHALALGMDKDASMRDQFFKAELELKAVLTRTGRAFDTAAQAAEMEEFLRDDDVVAAVCEYAGFDVQPMLDVLRQFKSLPA